MNETVKEKLERLLQLNKPQKTINTWNIKDLCKKINVGYSEEGELNFSFAYLYHYLGLKVIDDDIEQKSILEKSYELLKVSYFSEQYTNKLEQLQMLTQLAASGVTCSNIAEVRMMLDEEMNNIDINLFDNKLDKIYAITLTVFLLAIRKLHGWEDIRGVNELKEQLNILVATTGDSSKEDVLFILACLNIEESISEYIKYITTGKPANIEKVIIRKLLSAKSLFSEIGQDENALLSLLILKAIKEMVKNSLWASIEGVSEDLDKYLQFLVSSSNEKPIFDLWPSQQLAIKKNLFDATKSAVIVQMPTSAGKSLIAKLYIMQIKSSYQNAKIAYIVPTRALVNQVKRDLKADLQEFGFKVDIAIPFMDIDDVEEELLLKETDIIVTTPEKFDIMQRSNHPFIKELRLLIVDEAHNLKDAGRGAKLELLLAMLRKNDRNLKILMLSPFMKNAKEIAKWLSGDRGIDILVNWKPAQQFTGITYNQKKSPRGSIQKVRYLPCASNSSYSEEFTIDIKELSRQLDSKAKQAFLIAEQYKQLGGVLVLCTQPRFAESYASLYLDKEDISLSEQENIAPLLELIETEMGSDCLLYKVVKKGCAYHHSALPLIIREEIEDAIKNGYIHVVAATTTLAQGMNFPIATVIFQSMSIPQGTYTRAMDTSEFWNIAGRAGRALVDKEGHVICVCSSEKQEEQFEEYLKERNEEIISSLFNVVKDIPEECLGLRYIEQHPELSAFLQYVYHIKRLYEDMEIEDLLRGSFVYTNLEAEGNSVLAEKLLTITNKYIDMVSSDLSKKKLMDIIDRTGISSISMKKLIAEVRNKNFSIPNSNVLFSSRNNQLIDVINLVNSIPEINLSIFDSNSSLNAECIANITKMWVNGSSIRNIATECFESGEIEGNMSICGKYIYSRLINNLPWGVSAILKAQGIVKSTEEEDSHYVQIPSYIYFGVNNIVAVALCMLGVTRYGAHILSKEWYTTHEEIEFKECEKVREWLYNLSTDDWVNIFRKHNGKNAITNFEIWKKNK